MTVSAVALAELIEERRAALADVAALYSDPKVSNIPPGCKLLRPFGFDPNFLQLDANALRKRRDEQKEDEARDLRRPQHGDERSNSKALGSAFDAPAEVWGGWPCEGRSMRSGFPLSEDGSEYPVIQVPKPVQYAAPVMAVAPDSDKITELQEEVSRLKDALRTMQMGSASAAAAPASGGDWWDDPIDANQDDPWADYINGDPVDLPDGDKLHGGVTEEWWLEAPSGAPFQDAMGDLDLSWLENDPLVPQGFRASCNEYVEVFKEIDKNIDGLIEAHDAKKVMDESGLPAVELAHIWALCDEDRDGRLTLEEFLCAMQLVSLRRQGEDLPTELPTELIEMARSVAQENPAPRLSAQEPLEASWQELSRGMSEYREVFRDLDTVGSGYVSLQDARTLMARSEVPAEDLAYILRLCDVDRDLRLSFGEFVGAMHLVSRRREGGPLPSALPPDVSTVILSTAGLAPARNTGRSRWLISPEQLEKYHVIFQAVDQMGEGTAAPEQVRTVLERSQLPPEELSHIWTICDMDGDGRLAVDEFVCAIHITNQRCQGAPLPPEIPSELVSVAAVAKATLPPTKRLFPQKVADFTSQWVVSPQNWTKYRTIFQSLDRDSHGVISSDEARVILERSMLAHGELAEIWKLSDRDLDGQLSAVEFTIAMHLVFRRRQGLPLPSELPLELAITAEAPQVSQESFELSVDGVRQEAAGVFAGQNQTAPPAPPQTTQGEPPSIWLIASSSLTRFARTFVEQMDGEGFLTAEAAKPIMQKSELSDEELSQVWVLSDVNKDGRLALAEFMCAMHLIELRLQGHPLPDALPGEFAAFLGKLPELPYPGFEEALQAIGYSPSDHDPGSWALTPEQVEAFRKAFNSMRATGPDTIDHVDAWRILEKSKLMQSEINHIWKIADLNKDGQCTSFAEVGCAMHLASRCRKGVPLPDTLPPELHAMWTSLEPVAARRATDKGGFPWPSA
mmetsp:Transcript_59771/g.142235  ORF Transcript_59771/g.142235 Transcript_59771/m.142235 type:complete len:965 (+) Transcript_59771:72-2966(+)